VLRRRLTITSGRLAALLSCTLALIIFACTDERTGAGPRPPNAAPTNPEVGEDAPINLAHVCGNRFVITNAQSFPITVTYRVAESEEEGTADLAAAPRMDPAISEWTIEVRTKGAVQLFAGDRLLVTRANGGAPCISDVASHLQASLTGAQGGQWSAPFS
jgi:hypothetical protein